MDKPFDAYDAFMLGYVDGLAQPDDLTMGMTWTNNPNFNEAYDVGVNAGQRKDVLAPTLFAMKIRGVHS